MSRRTLIKSDLGACALAICSTLALSPALAAEFPTGSYQAKDVPYTVSFDNHGQFHVNKGDTLEVTGNFTAKASELQLTDTQGPWACTKDGEQTGTYTWKYENAVLTLTKVADKCDERVQSLVKLAWKREKQGT